MTDEPTWERRKDLAARLGISIPTLWRWVKAGRLPAPKRIGRTIFFDRKEVDAAIANGRAQ